MLKRWLSKRGYGAIEDVARVAFDRGDRVFSYKFHPRPARNDTDLAEAIAGVEAIGWTVTSQFPQGEGLQRFVSLTFHRQGS
ncbi:MULTISPECIES: hypothetical protein [unclassified Streptomyces]|uniref:hypothetical protein n=1 Tax=unclassified Streptomyces TaxID=2593676 RepID=UPI000688350C|nr:MULTISPECIES: hypothetical protein [unclassified Streptomyces]MYY03044.1 hypothetical protein [Streptomyces sp. SID4913]